MAPERWIYLASQSPRRRDLLAQLDWQTRPLVASSVQEEVEGEAVEERLGQETPSAYVLRVTHAKMDLALKRWQERSLPAAPVLTADTVVWMGSHIFGKPADAQDALRILRHLSGQAHQVSTAVALALPQQDGTWKVLERVSTSIVWMRELSDPEIRDYWDSGEPQGKAGAYAIQGRAAAWIHRVDGSHSGIMGLPLFETAELLSVLS